MHVHFTVCLFDLLSEPKPKIYLMEKIWCLIISINNFTRKIITCLNMLCLLLPNGLIQLNISAGKPVMFVHYVVCLFTNSDEWKYSRELFSKTRWQFVCFFMKRTFIYRYFFCKPCILPGTVPLGINQRQKIELQLSTYLRGLSWKTILEFICIIYDSQLT